MSILRNRSIEIRENKSFWRLQRRMKKYWKGCKRKRPPIVLNDGRINFRRISFTVINWVNSLMNMEPVLSLKETGCQQPPKLKATCEKQPSTPATQTKVKTTTAHNKHAAETSSYQELEQVAHQLVVKRWELWITTHNVIIFNHRSIRAKPERDSIYQ